MRVFDPMMINLAYMIGVPGSAGGELREAEIGKFYLGSDGYYYIVNTDGTIDQFFVPAPDGLKANFTEEQFKELGVILDDYIPPDI